MKFKVLFIIIIILGFLVTNSYHAQIVCTWNGTTSTDWEVVSNWTTTDGGTPVASAKPTALSTVIIPDVSAGSGNDPSMSASGSSASLTINTGGSLTINFGNVLDVGGNIDIDGTLTLSRGTIQCGGNWDDTDGTFTHIIFGTVNFDGTGTHTINCKAGNDFRIVTIDAGIYSALSNIIVDFSIDIKNGASYDPAGFTTQVKSGARTDIISGGTLNFSDANGIFDAIDVFDADDGANITFAANGRLKLAGASPRLGRINGAEFTSSEGTVEYDLSGGGSTQTIYDIPYFNLEIDGTDATDVKTANSNLDVDGTLTITNGNLTLNNIDLDLEGDFTMAAGSFAPGNSAANNVAGIWNETGGLFQPAAGTFTFSGTGGKTIVQNAGNFFNDLTVASGGTDKISANSAISVGGVFTNTNGTFDTEGNTVTVTGATNIDGGILEIAAGTFDANDFDANGATVTFTGTGTLNLGGNGGGAPDLGTLNDGLGGNITRGTVIYDNQAGSQAIYNAAYFNLQTNNNGQTATAASALTVFGDLKITTGNLTLDNIGLTLTGNFKMDAGSFVPGNSAVHTVSGSWDDAGGTFTPADGVISMNGAGTTQITSKAGNSFHKLSISAGIHEAQSIITVNDRLTIGGTLDMAGNDGSAAQTIISGTLSLTTSEFTASGVTTVPGGVLSIGTGIFNADGQFNADAGGGSVTFTGAGNLVCSSTADNTFGTLTNNLGTVTFDAVSGTQNLPNETFFNLTASNTDGLDLNGDVTVNGTLTFNTDGDITTAANIFKFASTAPAVTTATDLRKIIGNCHRGMTGTTEFYFPVGVASKYRPIKLTPTAGGTETVFKVQYVDSRSTAAAGASLANGGGVTGGLDHISGWYDPDNDPTATPLPPNPGNTPPSGGYHWTIERDNTDKNAVLFIEWTSEDTWGTNGNQMNTDIAPLVFARYNGTAWEEVPSTPLGLFSAGTLESDPLTDFEDNPFHVTLGSTDESLYLPIDLVSFTGECINNQTNIEFVVASQVNNEYFTIKRSEDLTEWHEVGNINGGGTTNEEITYNWTDDNHKSGVSYYKLFQTDIDGSTKSFEPIVVNCENTMLGYNVYPNPTNKLLSLELFLENYQGNNVYIVLKDLKGLVVRKYPLNLNKGFNHFEYDLSDIPNGVYLINYEGTTEHIPQKRFVKL